MMTSPFTLTKDPLPRPASCLLVRFGLVSLMLLASRWVQAQEEIPHINAGARAQAIGAPLVFSMGDVYEAASGWMVPLRQATEGPYAGWFHNEIVFGALPATPGFGGPYPESALPGTKIFIEVTRVEGPPGGVFTFWQTRSNTPSFRVPTGTADGTNHWKLTDGSGRPGTDPYGHRHGRRFAVDLPGIYTVGFTLRDLGTNGPGGGPIHTPSDLYLMRFLARPEPFTPPPVLSRITRTDGQWACRLVSEPNEPHALEASEDLVAWVTLTRFDTTNSVQSLLLPATNTAPARFFRVSRTPPQ
ncbi:MAG: hypothetical protein JNL97_08170 [Verrucomicrobiales bacterium]|nr:hypothetical protein [Verrucomicrobiales bacterium]